MAHCSLWLARLSLRWRLVLISFGLLTLLMAAFAVFLSLSYEHVLLDTQATLLKSQMQAALASLGKKSVMVDEKEKTSDPVYTSAPNLSVASSVSLSKRLQKIITAATGKQVEVALLSSDGEMLAGPDESADRSVVKLAPNSVQHWLVNREPYVLTSTMQGQREQVIFYPFLVWDGKTAQPEKGIVQLSTSTALIDQAISATRLSMAFGLVGVLAVGAPLTLLLIGRALYPLTEMERLSRRIASGEFSLRLEEPVSQDEPGRLARSFNRMVMHVEKAFARQKEFVGDVSHELRTPLTVLSGSLEMLLLEAYQGDTAAAHRLLRSAHAQVERLRSLVSDLLILSSLDERRMILCKERVDIGALVQEICAQAQCLSQGQDLQCTVAASLPVIYGDPNHLRRILFNIVENALKFTPASGRITLSARGEGREQVMLEIVDTGTGISPEAFPHVFERFYRGEPSRARASSQGGSGLGLAIAQELVHAHGGTITLKSTPGGGTTVSIVLPAIVEQ